MQVKRFKPEAPEWELVPEHMRGPLDRYISYGIAPGGFLEAVLCNDLSGAIARADSINRTGLVGIVNFLQWTAPSVCWGSEAHYLRWIKSGWKECPHDHLSEQAGSEDAGC